MWFVNSIASKYNLLVILLLLVTSHANKFLDPVARHDLHQCASMLCPEIYNELIDYLRSGCERDF
jgi:hypothetical protein